MNWPDDHVRNTSDRGAADPLSVDDALAWMAEMFEETRGKLTATTRRGEIAAWDSLGQLILMAALDQRFGIRLSQVELSSLVSVQDVLNVLERNRHLRRI